MTNSGFSFYKVASTIFHQPVLQSTLSGTSSEVRNHTTKVEKWPSSGFDPSLKNLMASRVYSKVKSLFKEEKMELKSNYLDILNKGSEWFKCISTNTCGHE